MKVEKVKISATVATVRRMRSLDQKWYGTPNSYAPYIASRPSWTYDIMLATPWDMIQKHGWDGIDDCDQEECNDDCIECREILEMVVEIPHR